MGKVSVFAICVVAVCVCLSGCGGRRDPRTVTLERVALDGDDVATALGLEVFKFEIGGPAGSPVEVSFWVEQHLRSQGATVTQTHDLARWMGEHLSGDLLLMLPGRNGPEYRFKVGASVARGAVPDSIRFDLDAGSTTRGATQVKARLGEPSILAVRIDSDETTGSSAESLDEYIKQNIALGEFKQILVYKARFGRVE